ncbi:MAG TPA: hypothetical protein VEL70_06665, partial [Candidatus Acidoferrum sp.]|nr:hypothetical protein [Candidatus Acidoferrum sp.]
NINHAQAVIGIGGGEFQKELGNNIQVQPYTFNAGSSAIQALLANRIDATYVGPGPAVNGYVASLGKGQNNFRCGKWWCCLCSEKRFRN